MHDTQLRQTIQERALEIIGTFVRLQRQGKQYVGLCPFHAETHPSFSVSPEKGVFHCFGCGAAGDCLSFLMRFKGLTFPEALAEATRVLGVPPPQPLCDTSTTARLSKAAERATQIFTHWLWQREGKQSRRYLQERGIHDATAKTFRLGFHPDHPTLLLRALTTRGVTAEDASALGLATRKDEHWVSCCRGRVIFPITDARGQVRGFGARALSTRGPKYLNSPDSPLFHKGQLLYGLAHARAAMETRGEAIVVEGYLDVVTLHQAGFTNTVSPLSTTLSTAQLTLLRMLAQRVVLLFDGDAAGQAAMTRAFVPAEASGVSVSVAILPRESDPDSYVRRHGRAALEQVLAHAAPLDAFVLDQITTQTSKAQASRAVLALAEQLTHPVNQLMFLQKAEVRLQLPAGSLSEALGIGDTARRRLEEVVAELVLTIPEVRAHLRGVLLPLRNPQLRTVVQRALQHEQLAVHEHGLRPLVASVSEC